MADDAHLLRRYVEARSQPAFAELVERHLGMVYHAAARQLGSDGHLASDVAQAVFLVLAQNAPRLVRHPNLAAWLHATTHFKTAEARRAEQRRRTREQAAQLMSELDQSPGNDETWRQIRPLLDAALLELSEPDREIVLLRYFEGHGFAEIAARHAVSENTAHKRVERALEKLRSRLAGRGIASTAAALAALLETQTALAAPPGLALSVTGAAMTLPAAAAGISAFSFMSSTKATVAAAVVILGLSGGFATYQIRADRAARAAAAAAQARRDAGLAREQEAAAQLGQAGRERESLQKKAALQAAGNAAPEPIPVRAERSPLRDGTEFLQKHPEVKAALVANYRSQFAAEYGAFYADQKLTPEQIARFEDIQMRAMRRILGTYTVTVGERQSTYQERQDELRELLGDGGLVRLKDYERANPERTAVLQLASAVYFTDTPLTASQADALRAIIRRAPPAGPKTNLGIARINWDAVITEARSALPPAQVAALEDMRALAAHSNAQSTAMSALPND
jgi:RNA polymerase sigma factor (sigma-70 family)